MISVWIIITFLLIHWLADFVAQTDWQAKNKSTCMDALWEHTLTYSAIWIVPAIALFNPICAAAFVLGTLVCHTITDYFTSRLNTRLFKANKIHEFFVSIGFDQILHYVQLFGFYLILR